MQDLLGHRLNTHWYLEHLCDLMHVEISWQHINILRNIGQKDAVPDQFNNHLKYSSHINVFDELCQIIFVLQMYKC